MTTVLAAFLVAFVVGALVTYAMTWVAPILGAVDLPDGFRKIHTRPIPYLGGIGVFAGFVTPIIILLACPRWLLLGQALWETNGPLFMVLGGSVVALLMGAWDDVRNLRPGWKLLLQTTAACIGMAGNLVIWKLSLPFIGDVELGLWGIPLTLFWFLGCMNAINLLDGMDGLAGGVSLIACITMLVAGQLLGNYVGMLLMAALGGGILGFLIHNFNPARIFLGDSGSNVIGYLIAALALMTSQKSNAAVAILIPVLALGVPITDTCLAIVRRWSQWLPISAPDRQHVHHILLGWGFSQRRVVLIIYAASIVLCAGALLSMVVHRELLLTVFAGLGIMVFVCIRVLGAVRLTDLRRRFSRDWNDRQASNQAYIEIEELSHRLPHLQDLDSIWTACEQPFERLGVHEARLAMQDGLAQTQPPREWIWSSPMQPQNPRLHQESWKVTLRLDLPGHHPAYLRLAGCMGNSRLAILHRTDVVWRLRDTLAAHVLRVRETAVAPDSVHGS
jgi:UDP-GlcNAc:undecaprenyl-phosphate GlcNAc-1-phosphate transferase